MRTESLEGTVGLFFAANDELLLHTCTLSEAESYGDFLNYPESHDEVWLREYFDKYHVDFDYFPRGRIIYNKKNSMYILYYDACISRVATKLCNRYPSGKITSALDEHYQCCKCNRHYVV